MTQPLNIGPGITIGSGVTLSGGGSAPPSPTPVNTVAPAVTGNLTVGSTLTSTTGTWTNSPSSYTYQWYYSSNTPISGATSSTYVTQTGDVGNSIYCRVTATYAGGSTAANSNTVGPIVAIPVNIAYLVVAGGGSGGWENLQSGTGGGGGAGGVLTGSFTQSANTVYTITVGAGGVGQTLGSVGNNGANSTIIGTDSVTFTAIGGGRGGGGANGYGTAASQSGGSGVAQQILIISLGLQELQVKAMLVVMSIGLVVAPHHQVVEVVQAVSV